MNKGLILMMVCILSSVSMLAQNKKSVDENSYSDWIRLGKYSISDDGKYVWYSWHSGSNLKYGFTLCYTESQYKKDFKAAEPEFVGNKLIYRCPGDTLGIFDLKQRTCNYITNVREYEAVESKGLLHLIYRVKDAVTIKEMKKGKSFTLENVKQYYISPNKNYLAYTSKKNELFLVNIIDGKIRQIFASPIRNFAYSQNSTAVAFLSTGPNDKLIVFQYSIRSGRLTRINPTSDVPNDNYVTDQLLKLSPEGDYVYVQVKSTHLKANANKKPHPANLSIWNYKDLFLDGEKGSQDFFKTGFVALISVAKRRLVLLENDTVELVGDPSVNSHYVIRRNIVNQDIAYFNESQRPKYRLLEIRTGREISFVPANHLIGEHAVPVFSPKGNFISWEDKISGQLYVFSVSQGKFCRNLSQAKCEIKSLSSIWAWLPNDAGYIASEKDQSAIWQFDTCNQKSPIKLIGGAVNARSLRFQLPDDNIGQTFLENTLTVRVLDSNSNNGFATVKIGKPETFKLGELSPYLYSWGLIDGPENIRKARRANKYVVSRQSANASPNAYITSDLINFKRLSEIWPEREFNWITSELIRWKMYDGRIGKGILYKPENFDSSKKYPVLFHYYQQRSDELHKFWQVGDEGELGNSISISEYVSNGYIVFVPDILNYEKGEIARNTVNSVESAAKFLKESNSWVDSTRLGLVGHSFGGYETNILISNSKIFAAASSSNGISDLVSWRSQPGFGQKTMDGFIEVGQMNMGLNVSPWNCTEKYIENSPIFKANMVSTPLLLKHTSDDSAVSFMQSFEWFTALRRLAKPVWLLNYLTGDHIMSGSDAKDFNLRQRQFFDHYLKGKPIPLWMKTSSSTDL